METPNAFTIKNRARYKAIKEVKSVPVIPWSIGYGFSPSSSNSLPLMGT